MKANTIVKHLKTNSEDFEWYPTTKSQLDLVRFYIELHHRKDYNGVLNIDVMDIGSGDGRALQRFTDGGKRFIIEKSTILLKSLSNIENSFVIGTDFHQQSLIDKQCDVIFCNPPYSEFEHWVSVIIKTCNCQQLYLIIPDRWKESKSINEALHSRNVKAKVLESSDFLDGDRIARAKVDVIEVNFIREKFSKGASVKGAFDLFFEENFTKDDATKENRYSDLMDEYDTVEDAQSVKNELVKNDGLVNVLERFYNRDLENIFDDYKRISELDKTLLLEVGVSFESMKESLRMKLKSTKAKYWSKLFNNLDVIKRRFTQEQRTNFIKNLTEHSSVEFSIANCHGVILWALEQANTLRDTMIQTTIDYITHDCEVNGYKSNEKVFVKNKHKYNNMDEPFKLDYRLVTERMGKIDFTWTKPRLYGRDENCVHDLKVIGYLLGFDLYEGDKIDDLDTGKSYNFHYTKDGVQHILFDIKWFKKGTAHIRFSQEFMMKINVEMGRIKGWVFTKDDVKEEFDVSDEEASKLITNHFKNTLTMNNVKLLK